MILRHLGLSAVPYFNEPVAGPGRNVRALIDRLADDDGSINGSPLKNFLQSENGLEMKRKLGTISGGGSTLGRRSARTGIAIYQT